MENFCLCRSEIHAKLVKYVVLYQATPRDLALFAEKSSDNEALIDELLASPKLMKQMLVALVNVRCPFSTFLM